MNPILIFTSVESPTTRDRRSSLRMMLLAVTLGTFIVGFSSCATARGLGRDVQKGGEKIEEAASR